MEVMAAIDCPAIDCPCCGPPGGDNDQSIRPTSRRLVSFGRRPACKEPWNRCGMTPPFKGWFWQVIEFLKSPEGGVYAH